MSEFVYVNGRLTPEDKANVSVFDYGLLYGMGVFESMRAYECRVFRLDEHLKRLRHSAGIIGLQVNGKKVEAAVKATLQRNRLRDAYVRVTVTGGRGKTRLAFDKKQEPCVIVVAQRLPEGIEEKQRVGVKAGFSKIMQYSRSPLCAIKSTNYLQTALRKKEAIDRGLDDVIVVNEEGRIAEASTSNVFMVDKKGVLATPKIEDGCLPGITRKTVLEAAGRLGMKAAEKTITPAQLMEAKEVFLTNSIMELVPVTAVEGKRLNVGETTRTLQKEYRRLALASRARPPPQRR